MRAWRTTLPDLVGGPVRTLVRTTVRGGVHLLLGGVVLIPYVLLVTGFAQMFADPNVPRPALVVLVAVTFVIAAVPPFLPAMRALEITATRSLLDVDLPDPVADPPWETRLLGAAWYALHLLCGGIAMFTLLFCVPMSVLLVAEGLDADSAWGDDDAVLWFDQVTGGWALVVAPLMLVAVGVVFALLGRVLAMLAPLLLGPSPAELMLALETQAEEFAERNRLARELHDSVGHALTVTTLQASAARRVLDSDPEFARRALSAVEEAGRAAMSDLDHVLGVLRAGGDGTDERTAPQRTLDDLSRLVDDTRATGVEVQMTVEGDLAMVPPALSREAYRVVQEGLTNAIRHAGQVPVALRVEAATSGLDIDLSNPLPAGSARARSGGGRGLRGMRERARLLRGTLTAGVDDGRWHIHVHLPARGSGDRP